MAAIALAYLAWLVLFGLECAVIKILELRGLSLRRGFGDRGSDVFILLWYCVPILIAFMLYRLAIRMLVDRVITRRNAAGCCIACAFDMSNLPREGAIVCPECGSSLPNDSAPPG